MIKRFFQISTVILTALLGALDSQANMLESISPDTRLASEIAISRTLEKALLLRRTMLTGTRKGLKGFKRI